MVRSKCPLCGRKVDALIGAVIDTERQFICKNCFNGKMKQAVQILKDYDKKIFYDRVTRQVELGTVIYSATGKQPPYYLLSYLHEAAEAYRNGCYKSCIFCCAEVVEQIIKHELIQNSKDPEEKQWKFEIKKSTFGDLISEAKGIARLRKYLNDTQWLNELTSSSRLKSEGSTI